MTGSVKEISTTKKTKNQKKGRVLREKVWGGVGMKEGETGPCAQGMDALAAMTVEVREGE